MRLTASQARAMGASLRAARPRTPRIPGQPNRTEGEHALRLEVRKRAGEVVRYEYESVTLKLGFDCRYTPDFFVVLATGALEFHETKGPHAREDSIVKLRAAATKYPEFTFRFFQRHRDGTWTEKAVRSA